MSYLVLARKYRPKRFDDLVGQEHVARTLSNAIALDRVHHAFLFTGARGVGKTSAARILAMALACEKGPTANPCGACGLCTEIARGQSVDVMEIDGASNTSVDDVRVLRDGVAYAPSRARKKIYIIDEVHMLSTSAFNALLKTLEEPPSHVVFILATTEVHKIPTTIMSRVQRYDFKLIAGTRLAQHLGTVLTQEKIKHDADAVRVIARQAAGSVRDALSLLDQVIAFVGDEPLTVNRVSEVLGLADKTLLMDLARAVVARQPGDALRMVAGAIDRGVDLTQIARNLQVLLHDIELCTLLDEPADVVDLTADEIAEARALGRAAPRGLWPALFDRWSRAIEEGARATAPRLIYEMAILDLCTTEPLLPLGDLIARLEGVEARLGGAGAAGGGGTGAGRGGARAGTGSTTPDPRTRRASQEDATPMRATPAPQPRPAYIPKVSIDTPIPFWDAVKLAAADQSPRMAAALEHTQVESLGPGQITLVSAERFLIEQMEKARPVLETLISAVADSPMRINIKQGQGPAPIVESQATLDADTAKDDRRQREEEARKHPMIQKAQDLFGARVTGVRT